MYIEKINFMIFFYNNNFVSRLCKIIFFLFVILSCLNVQAQNYPVVQAQKGDGIYSLLRRNGLEPTKYIKTFISINKSKLGKNNSLFAGRNYFLPLAGNRAEVVDAEVNNVAPHKTETKGNPLKTIVYPLFGKKYQTVTIKDHKLKGAIYYLVGGHGGPDPGAMGKLNGHVLCEDEYAYDVVLRMSRCLMEHDAKVYLIIQDLNDGIRDEPYLIQDRTETCYPHDRIPLNHLARLKQRVDVVNKLYIKNKGVYQRMLVVHVDSRSKKENIDVFFYHDKRSKTGKKMAETMKNIFQNKYDYYQPNRGYSGTVSSRNLYVLKHSYPTAVYMEIANINHLHDLQRLIIVSNRQALAEWMTEGILTDYKNCHTQK